jgi:hypothetical protein
LFRLLVVLLLLIIVLGNIVAIVYYRRKRGQFLRLPDAPISMNERPVYEARHESRPRPVSMLSTSVGTMSAPSSNADDASQMTWTRKRLVQLDDVPRLPNEVRIENIFDLRRFRQRALQEHNTIRTKHGKQLLKLSDALNIYAQVTMSVARVRCSSFARSVRFSIGLINVRVQRTSFLHKPNGDRSATDKRWPRVSLSCNRSTRSMVSGVERRRPVGVAECSTCSLCVGVEFTQTIVANADRSKQVAPLFDNTCRQVGFGCAHYALDERVQQWIGVAHYCPSQI